MEVTKKLVSKEDEVINALFSKICLQMKIQICEEVIEERIQLDEITR